MVWIKQGHALVKHLTPIIIMAVSYCGPQLTRSLGWSAPAYHEKEGATPHPGVCNPGLQYDGRPDGRFGVRVGTWNVGSLS